MTFRAADAYHLPVLDVQRQHRECILSDNVSAGTDLPRSFPSPPLLPVRDVGVRGRLSGLGNLELVTR